MKKENGIRAIKERIKTELTATSYGIHCINIAFGMDEGESEISFADTNIASEYRPTLIEYPFEELYTGRMENYSVARGTANQIAAMLVGTVYEILTQDDQKYWNKYNLYDCEEIAFLQWVRHGVFHSNRFVLDRYEGGAKWNGVEITPDMEGQVVFTEVDWENKRFVPDPKLPEGHGYSEEDTNQGLLEAGDGLMLTQDVLKELDDL